MSTARLDYTVEKLRTQIDAKHAEAVAAAEAECAKELDLPARRATWRKEQEKRVRSLARRLRDVSDQELSDFSVRSMPSSRYHYGSAEGRKRDAITTADERRTRAIRRLDGLRAPDGTVSLTAKMLSDWFGL